MESGTYEFPPRVGGTDLVVGLTIFVVSLIAIWLGYLA